MVVCDGANCPFEWFHYKCVGLDKAPESEKWYCEDCLNDTKRSIIGITHEKEVTVTGPSPTSDWKSAANDFLAIWSQTKITMASQTVKKIPCKSIEPHVRDSVLGDGNCLFRPKTNNFIRVCAKVFFRF